MVVSSIFLSFTTVFISSQQEYDSLSMKQMQLIQQLEGTWQTDTVFLCGRELTGRNDVKGVAFTKNGMLFIGPKDSKKGKRWIFTKIDPDKKLVNLLHERNGVTQTYSLRIDKKEIRLTRRIKMPSKLPDKTEPDINNLCFVLKKNNAK